MRTIVLRGTGVLARPSGTEGGPVPDLEEVEAMNMTLLNLEDHSGFRIFTEALGEPPEGWRWIPLLDLQREAGPELAAEIGEAFLC